MVWVLPVAIGGLVGVGMALSQSQLLSPAVYAALLGISLIGLVMAAITTMRPHWLLLCLCSTVLGFAQTSLRATWQATQILDPSLENQIAEVSGVVVSLPERTAAGWRFRFEVDAPAPGQPPIVLVNGVSRFQAKQAPIEFKALQRWRLVLRWRQPYGFFNPQGFDSELWFWEQGLGASAQIVNATPVQMQTAFTLSPAKWMLGWRQSLRDALQAQVKNPAHAGILAALTMGDQASIERSDWDIFRATGVAHLMAISGLHITALAWLAAQAMRWIWPRLGRDIQPWAWQLPTPWIAALTACVTAILYAWFAGWGLPAQRTVWMLCCFIGLRQTCRHWPWVYVFLLVAWWLAMCDPMALLQAGFWLSFVAVGILFSAGRVTWSAHPWLQQIGDRLREQWLMSVCLAPLSLVLFGQVSLVGLLANLAAVPWVTLVITPLSLLGLLWRDGWTLADSAIGVLLSVLEAMRQWPAATWQSTSAPWGWRIVGLLSMVFAAMRLPWWIKGLGVMWVWPLLSWQPTRMAQGEFEIWTPDVGQGQALVIRTASHTLLYDSGPAWGGRDAAQSILLPWLHQMGWIPDALLISHSDIDHSGGLQTLAQAYPAMQLVGSFETEHPLKLQWDIDTCEAGMHWQWDDVQFEILHPDLQATDQWRQSNALSCVLKITSQQGRTALLVGDIEAAQEKSMLQHDVSLRADWLLVPHHGSLTSSSEAFVQAVHPWVAQIQAGYLNRFGHPRQEIILRYREIGAQVVQTPQCGASRWSSQSPESVQCERLIRKRYWHHRF